MNDGDSLLRTGMNIAFILVVLISFHTMKYVAFASETQFPVSFLVLEKFLELCERLPIVSARQNVRVTRNK